MQAEKIGQQSQWAIKAGNCLYFGKDGRRKKETGGKEADKTKRICLVAASTDKI